MAIRTTRFDAMKNLTSNEAQAELLGEVLDSGSQTAIAHVMREIARARGMVEMAALAGIDQLALFAAVEKDDADAEARLVMAALTRHAAEPAGNR